MATPLSKFMVPPAVSAPRGALWAAACASSAAAAVWRVLQAIGHARGSRALLALARQRADLDPALARQLRMAGEAAAVRALAFRQMKSDPRHAADLLAAADRHELLGAPADAAVQGNAAWPHAPLSRSGIITAHGNPAKEPAPPR